MLAASTVWLRWNFFPDHNIKETFAVKLRNITFSQHWLQFQFLLLNLQTEQPNPDLLFSYRLILQYLSCFLLTVASGEIFFLYLLLFYFAGFLLFTQNLDRLHSRVPFRPVLQHRVHRCPYGSTSIPLTWPCTCSLFPQKVHALCAPCIRGSDCSSCWIQCRENDWMASCFVSLYGVTSENGPVEPRVLTCWWATPSKPSSSYSAFCLYV